MLEGVKKISNFLLECVFPFYCVGCGESDHYFCVQCRQADWFQKPGISIEYLANSFLSANIFLSVYAPGTVFARLIEDFKYAFIWAAAEQIEQMLKNTVDLAEKLPVCDLIVPVPLHSWRLAERGYNQAEIIANFIAEISQKPVNIAVLFRSRATAQQAKLSRVERLVNVKTAFVCNLSKKIIGKNILLVDDVYTTGSTMQECAKVLLAGGAKTVSGFTLARG